MLTNITLHNIASYTEKVNFEPNTINYIYGSNGSGKTSLSKVISSCGSFSDCSLSWKASQMKTLVYNEDFVADNFGQSKNIKGIFTLGKETKDAKQFIEQKRNKIEEIKGAIYGLRSTLEEQEEKEETETEKAVNTCWEIKKKYEDLFEPAYKGFIRSKKRFFKKCLSEKNSNEELLIWDEIKEKCNKIYNDSLKRYSQTPKFSYDKLKKIENNEILNKAIVGKDDLPIARLYNKLNNSDWVNNGLKYLNESNSKCPFCQQDINENLKNEIENFFDQTYSEKCKELESFKNNYINYVSNKIEELKDIINIDIPIINFEKLDIQIKLIQEKYKSNLNLIEKKLKSPSIPIELESFSEDFFNANEIIESFRDTIQKNNDIFDNLKEEKMKLDSQVWRFITNEIMPTLDKYQDAINGIEKAQINIKKQISDFEKEKKSLIKKVNEKESEVTSTLHTVNEINKILNMFGFTNFKISQAKEKGYYKLIREDGSDVKGTLSEGEYTFITFLYFYYLLKDSTNESGLIQDKIVVIDDPVSSLDSSVLFVVSNLIKNIISDCQNNKNGIKQIFILTHNVYFHKEVTFKGTSKNKSNQESYWVIKKLNDVSDIDEYSENPIQTTYELLWRELQDIETINKATIFNTLRRILEYYFNIIGGLDYEKCINKFDGEEKIICKTLISWINDGSHFINDDLAVHIEPETIEKYLGVFKEIFIKMDHESHYNMMMEKCDLT